MKTLAQEEESKYFTNRLIGDRNTLFDYLEHMKKRNMFWARRGEQEEAGRRPESRRAHEYRGA
jgi:hypothetical protein